MQTRNFMIRGGLVLSVLAFGLTAYGDAITLDVPVYNVLIGGAGGGFFHSAGTYSNDLSMLSITPTPELSIVANAPDSSRSSVSANVTYNFEFFYDGVGLPPDATVPVLIHTVLNADAGGSGQAIADISVDGGDFGTGIFAFAQCNQFADCSVTHVDTVLHANLSVYSATDNSTIHSIQLEAGANGPGPGGFSFASADPIISIDPSFADAGLYTLAFSAGIGNGDTSGAPEPSSLGLVSLGMAALAFSFRWTRKA